MRTFPLPCFRHVVFGFLLWLGLGILHANAALTGTFTVNSRWDSGFSATLVVVNSGSADVNNWTGSLATRDTLASW